MNRGARSSQRPLRALVLAASLALVAGCGFADPAPIVPSYTCSSASQCHSGDCVAGVCAATSVVPYALVLQVVQPSTANIPGLRSWTFDPYPLVASEAKTIVFPVAHPVFGLVRFGLEPVASQVTFTRTFAVAGNFVDDVRVITSDNTVAEDGSPADYRVVLADSGSYVAVAVPATSRTPALNGVPPELVDRPLNEVFPPIAATFDPAITTSPTSRLDFFYTTSLFYPCTANTISCTAVGRLVSRDVAGTASPEAGVRVVLESTDTLQPISTTAITAADGTFEIRISSTRGRYRLRLGPSASRLAYPTMALAETAFDPVAGGDVTVPHFNVVRYVGQVEFGPDPVPGALVRAVARTLRDERGFDIFGASYEAVVRTTSAASVTTGPGRFALELLEGDYDIVASDSLTDSSLVRASTTVTPPPGGAPLQGQVFALGPASSLAGTVVGPDGNSLTYAQVQAIPFVPSSRRLLPEAYARPTAGSSDEAGYFDLHADPGFYDLVISVPGSEGLPDAIVPGIPIGNSLAPPWLPVHMPYAAVLHGLVQSADGAPIPGARVDAYVYLPATGDTFDRTVAVGHAIADGGGAYRLVVPSRLLGRP